MQDLQYGLLNMNRCHFSAASFPRRPEDLQYGLLHMNRCHFSAASFPCRPEDLQYACVTILNMNPDSPSRQVRCMLSVAKNSFWWDMLHVQALLSRLPRVSSCPTLAIKRAHSALRSGPRQPAAVLRSAGPLHLSPGRGGPLMCLKTQFSYPAIMHLPTGPVPHLAGPLPLPSRQQQPRERPWGQRQQQRCSAWQQRRLRRRRVCQHCILGGPAGCWGGWRKW